MAARGPLEPDPDRADIVPLPALRYTRLTVARVDSYPGGTREVFLEGDIEPALPGQFLMVDAEPDATVMRPYTVFRAPAEGVRTLLVRGRLPDRLAPGQDVSVLGPLGQPFPVQTAPTCPPGRLWVAVEEGRIAPLYGALQALPAPARDRTRVLVSGTVAAHFDGLTHLEALGLPVTVGQGAGLASAQLLEGLQAEDHLWVAMPQSRLATLADALEERNSTGLPVPAAALAAIETEMACGVGACYGCPVRLRHPADERHPYVRACAEGPVLSLREVILG